MWFRHFLTGCHCRMGDVWIPDRAMQLDEVLGCLDILELEYVSMTQGGQRQLEVCLTSALLIVGYTAALRGEEIPQVYLGMMRKYWGEGRDYTRKPRVPLTLAGRFKQTNGATKL
ncbi:hypothetical protein ACA910_007974 [Epithemia clementina (nom. ined.)]